MKRRNGAIAALLFLTTCNVAEQDRSSASVESSSKALGQVPASEVATWTKVGEVSLPSADWVRVQGSLPEGFDHKPGLQWRLRSALTSAARYWVDNVEISASRD